MAERSPKLTYGADRKSFDSAKLIDGNPGTAVLLPLPQAGQPQYVNIEFPEPFTAQALTVALDTWNSRNRRGARGLRRWPELPDGSPADGALAGVFREFREGDGPVFRILLRPQGDGFSGSLPMAFRSARWNCTRTCGSKIFPGRQLTSVMDVFSGEPTLPPEMTVRRDQVMDLSAKMDQDGQFAWDVPEGKWTVLRIGHTSTGKMNHPAPKESLGLECDKLSKKAIEAQFAGLMGKLLEDQAAIGGKALTMTHIDSWEVGSQNWTPGFREEFQKRYGYDLLPYLPVLTGRAVESREVSERFLWDLRRMVADLLLENYAGHMQEISHQHGLTLSIEAYGGGPLDEVAYGGRADVPMSEFWTGIGAWYLEQRDGVVRARLRPAGRRRGILHGRAGKRKVAEPSVPAEAPGRPGLHRRESTALSSTAIPRSPGWIASPV